MKQRSYRPIEDAPRDGQPIVGVCGGVEAVVCFDDPLPGVLDAGWWYWDDDEMGASHERPRDQPQKWRPLF